MNYKCLYCGRPLNTGDFNNTCSICRQKEESNKRMKLHFNSTPKECLDTIWLATGTYCAMLGNLDIRDTNDLIVDAYEKLVNFIENNTFKSIINDGYTICKLNLQDMMMESVPTTRGIKDKNEAFTRCKFYNEKNTDINYKYLVVRTVEEVEE